MYLHTRFLKTSFLNQFNDSVVTRIFDIALYFFQCEWFGKIEGNKHNTTYQVNGGPSRYSLYVMRYMRHNNYWPKILALIV